MSNSAIADSGSVRLSQMIRSYWVSQVIGTLARLEIADHLAAGPLGCGALAKAIQCEPDPTMRLLRASVHVGLLTMLPDGRFGLTQMGELLRSGVPGSMRNSAIALTAPGHWLPWGRLTEAVRRGKRQTISALGDDLFDYYVSHPGEGDAFTGAMADHSNTIASQLALAFDTTEHDHAVDIGGASGAIIGAFLEANPGLRGTIFDRAEVVPRAQAAIVERGLSSRCEVMAGDFFKSVPAADLYILKSILHDWDDEQSVAILCNCVRAMRANGRLIIVERVVSEQGDPGEAALSDINMLVLLPGRERSVSQYAQLLGKAGLKLNRTIGLGALMLAIESSPAT